MVGPSQGGLGLGFFFGGGWYRTRFDFDLGMANGTYHTGMVGSAPRLAVPLAAAVLGFLTVLAASQPRQDLRESRRLEIADLIEQEGTRVDALRAELAGLRTTLDSLAAVEGLEQVARRLDRLEHVAGTAPLEGPGVVVTLDDSAASRSPTGDPNDLLVHEADIQAVVNALWSAGAEAVAVGGERLTSLSAVRCAGNTLLIHGQVHSPPYEIAAIGGPGLMQGSLAGRPGMGRLLAAVDAFGIRLAVEPGTVTIDAGPADTGLALARPAP